MSGGDAGGRVFPKEQRRSVFGRQETSRHRYPPILLSAQDQENRTLGVFLALLSPGPLYGAAKTHPTIHDAESRAARARPGMTWSQPLMT
jgi:hypothetical protein